MKPNRAAFDTIPIVSRASEWVAPVMIVESTRDMSTEERGRVRKMIESPPRVTLGNTLKWSGIWSAGLVALSAVAVALLAILAPVSPLLAAVVIVVPMLASFVFLFCLIAVISSDVHWRRIDREFRKRTIPLLQDALEQGQVRAKHVRASAVIEIPEFEDEGSGYLFDIGDGKSLLLKGQRYFPNEESMPWPAGDFEIIRTARGDLWLGLFSRGDELKPTTTVPMEQFSTDFAWSEREDVLEGSPEEVLHQLLTTVDKEK